MNTFSRPSDSIARWAGIFAVLLAACGTTQPYVQFDKPGHYSLHFRSQVEGVPFAARVDWAKAYVLSHNLVPPECANGIQVLSVGDSEGGYAHAHFVCAT